MFQIKKLNGAETDNMRAKTFTNIYDVSSFLIVRQVTYSFLYSRLMRWRRILRWPASRIFSRSSHLVCQVNHHIRRSVSYICYSQGNLRVLAAVLSCLPLLLSSSAWHCCLCPCSSVSRWTLIMPRSLTKYNHLFQVVKEYERAVIFRLGRLLSGGARGPGVFFIIPCVDVYEKIDMRTTTFEIPPQEVRFKFQIMNYDLVSRSWRKTA